MLRAKWASVTPNPWASLLDLIHSLWEEFETDKYIHTHILNPIHMLLLSLFLARTEIISWYALQWLSSRHSLKNCFRLATLSNFLLQQSLQEQQQYTSCWGHDSGTPSDGGYRSWDLRSVGRWGDQITLANYWGPGLHVSDPCLSIHWAFTLDTRSKVMEQLEYGSQNWNIFRKGEGWRDVSDTYIYILYNICG